MTPRAWRHKLWRIEQGEKGLCVRCSAPAVPGISVCERHRAIQLAYCATKLRSTKATVRPCTCGRCGGPRHNVRTCTQPPREGVSDRAGPVSVASTRARRG